MQIMMLTGNSLSVTPFGKEGEGGDGQLQAASNTKLHRGSLLKRNPASFWNYWDGFYRASLAIKPGVSHQMISRLAKLSDRFLEVTQDIGGRSVSAGLHLDQLLELHGSLHEYSCLKCGASSQYPAAWGAGDGPRCAVMNNQCNGLIRPHAILLGENLSLEKLNKAQNFLLKGTDLLVVAGTCVDFEYQGYLMCGAVSARIPVLFVDPIASPFCGTLLNADFDVDLVTGIVPIQLPADQVLPLLVDHLERITQAGTITREDILDTLNTIKAEAYTS
jgi:NAD-dependent SIR2 family protein deacetylase